jgi:hypothetical protein
MKIKVFWGLYSSGSEDITFLQNGNNTPSHSRRPKSQKYSFEDLVY